MSTAAAVAARPLTPTDRTSCRSTASTTSSCTSATPLQAAYFSCTPSASREVAYAGLETGMRDRASHVLQQGRIRLVLTGALHSGPRRSPRTTHRHGDGVKVIALSVPDVDHAYREATTRGADGRRASRTSVDRRARHRPRSPTIATYGETLHTFVERADYTGAVPPRLRGARERRRRGRRLLLAHRPHRRQRRARRTWTTWVKYYEDVFGMTRDDPLLRRGRSRPSTRR